MNRVLKNVMSVGETRQYSAKRRSLYSINEQFEPNVNAVWPSAIVFQHPVKRGIVLLCIILMLSGCGLFGKKEKPPPPPPPPEPTRVVLEFEAASDINPNSEGRASPLYLRIYQLKAYTVFENADFFSLYDKDDQILARDLVAKEEILLKPNEKRTVFYEVPDDTGAIGLLGLFMDYENTRWKAVAGVQPNKTTVIRTHISQAGLTIR